MDQQALQEEYEEAKMKLLMARFAELEGKIKAALAAPVVKD